MPNGEVNCLGGHGMKGILLYSFMFSCCDGVNVAQFFVHGHQHKSGVVTLQNAMFPDKYLRICEGKVTVVRCLFTYGLYSIHTYVYTHTQYLHIQLQGSGKETDCEFKFHEKGEAHTNNTNYCYIHLQMVLLHLSQFSTQVTT